MEALFSSISNSSFLEKAGGSGIASFATLAAIISDHFKDFPAKLGRGCLVDCLTGQR